MYLLSNVGGRDKAVFKRTKKIGNDLIRELISTILQTDLRTLQGQTGYSPLPAHWEPPPMARDQARIRTQCQTGSGPSLKALGMGQVGRVTEGKQAVTVACNKHHNTHNLRKLWGWGKRSWEETNFSVGKCIRSLKMDGNWIPDYMAMIHFGVMDRMADPIC